MKILIVSPFEDATNGGVGIAVKRLSRALQTQGDEIFLLTMGKDNLLARGRISTLDGTSIKVRQKPRSEFWGVYGPMWNDSAEIESLTEILTSLSIELIHVHHLIHMGTDLLAILRKTFPNKPIVYTHHDAWAICQAEGQLLRRDTGEHCLDANPFRCANCCHAYGNEVDPRNVFVRNQFSKKVLHLADVHTAPSKYFASRIGRDLGLEVNFLPNIPPTESVAQRPERPSLTAKRPSRIGFFGQLVATKGLNNLITAVENYNNEYPFNRVTLDIHGDGPLKAEVMALTSGSTQISYQGPYRSADVGRLMTTVDWVAVPSYWPENAPVVITEALAAGVPVMVSSRGGKQELVSFNVNSIEVAGDLISDWINAIAKTQASDSISLWERLSFNCRVKNDFESTLKLTRDLYQMAIRKSASSLTAK